MSERPHNGTPRPWPEHRVPTVEELSVWLRACTEQERQRFLTSALDDSARAHRCLLMNHESAIHTAQWQVRQLVARVERYRLAWLSARRGRLRERDRARWAG